MNDESVSLSAKALINFQFPHRNEVLYLMDENTVKIFEDQALLVLFENQLVERGADDQLQIDFVQVDSQSILVDQDEGKFVSSLFVTSSVYGSLRGDWTQSDGNRELDSFVDSVFQGKVDDFMDALEENSLYFEQLLDNDVSTVDQAEESNEGETKNSMISSDSIFITVSLVCITAIVCTACFVYSRRRDNSGKFDAVNSYCAGSNMSRSKPENMKQIDLESASISVPSEAHRIYSRSIDSESMLPPSIISDEGSSNKATDVESNRVITANQKDDHGTIGSSGGSSYDFYKSRMNVYPGDESQTTVTTDIGLNPYEPASKIPSCDPIKENSYSIAAKVVTPSATLHRNNTSSPFPKKGIQVCTPQEYSTTVQRIKNASTSRSSSPARSSRSAIQSEKNVQVTPQTPTDLKHPISSISPCRNFSNSPSTPLSPPTSVRRSMSKVSHHFSNQKEGVRSSSSSSSRQRSSSLQPKRKEQEVRPSDRSHSVAPVRLKQRRSFDSGQNPPVFPAVKNSRDIMESSIEKWMQSKSARLRRLSGTQGESPASSISTQKRSYDLRSTLSTDDQSHISNTSSVTYSSQQGLIPNNRKSSSSHLKQAVKSVQYYPPPLDLQSTISNVSREVDKISIGENSDFKQYCMDIERGPLRVVIDYGEHTNWMPLLYSIKPESPLFGEVQEGDIILKVDGVGTKGMPADHLAKLVKHHNKDNPEVDPIICSLVLQSGSDKCHI